MSITPGPNNLMVTSSAATFGFGRTLPHILGVAVGFPVLFAVVGLGLGTVFETYPASHDVLRVLGAMGVAYLAWRIATAAPPDDRGQTRGRPLKMIEAAAFQWVNPKAWVLAVSAIATYVEAGADPTVQVLAMSGIFLVIAFGSSSTWAGFGVAIGRLLKSRRAVRIFNVTMAALVVASMVPALAG